MKICMIGLGRLGLPCAEVMSRAHQVKGYDICPGILSNNIDVCDNISQAVNGCDAIFIAVQTPHEPNYGGEKPTSHLPPRDFDYDALCDVLRQLDAVTTSNQTIIVISTVLPGITRARLQSLVTKARLIYNPYLIAMGTVMYDMVHPEMIIAGSSNGNKKDFELLQKIYEPIMKNKPRWIIGTWEEAESTKIFYNTFISTKIGLVNMIQDVAQKIGHMNVDVVTSALATSTQRIMGPSYMKSGMGDGGACHPRDNIALRHLSQKLNLGYDFFGAIMQGREAQASNLAKFLLEYGKTIVIIGKAYKPGVSYIDGSSSILTAHYIESMGGCVYFIDRNTGDNDHPEDDRLVYLIGYHEQWIHEINYRRNSIIIDPWRQFTTTRSDLTVINYGNTRS